jgi:hypothetical protein
MKVKTSTKKHPTLPPVIGGVRVPPKPDLTWYERNMH